MSGISDDAFSQLVSRKELLTWREANLGRLVRCHACSGFWVGMGISLWQCGFVSEFFIGGMLEIAILDGFLLSGFNFCLWILLKKLGAEEL